MFVITSLIIFTHRSARSLSYPGKPLPPTTDSSDSSDASTTAPSSPPTSASSPTPSSSTPTCPSDRVVSVAAPPAPDQTYLSSLWTSLSQNFEKHGPSPKNLPHPKHAQGSPPKAEKVGTDFEFTEQQARESRLAHELMVKELPEYPSGKFQGRGVVMLGGGRYSEFADTSLAMLRAVGSTLPAELWVADPSEETPGWCEELAEIGVACRRLSDYMDREELKHPYAWKTYTLLYSSFAEILFLDADSMPVKNPEFIFDHAVYEKNGVILWPDYWNNSGSPWAPYITGETAAADNSFQDQRSVESGQMMWNKATHWKSLLLSAYYNYWGPDFYYTVFNNGYAGWGDKDTFPFALRALGQAYHMVALDLGTLFVTGTVHGIGMLQADPTQTSYAPLFLHGNMVKWSARKFFCDDHCPALGTYTVLPSHMQNAQSAIYSNLRDGVRVYNMKNMLDLHIDPEPTVWRAMEHAACRSRAWSQRAVCDRVRDYMRKALGAHFSPVGPSDELGPHNQMCLHLPHTAPS